jgi:hypothetical protein
MANILYLSQQEHDPSVDATGFNFPATTDYVKVVGPNHTFEILAGSGDPSTNHNNAANGSLYIDMTNFALYIKTAASTWVVVGTQS